LAQGAIFPSSRALRDHAARACAGGGVRMAIAMSEARPGDVIGAGGHQHLETFGHELPQQEEWCGVQQEGLSPSQRRWALWLSVMSLFDLAISGTMIFVALSHAYRDNGVSLYCLAIQAFSHLVSSLLLALRFCSEYRLPQDAPGIGVERGLLRAKRRDFLVREQGMSVIMGIVMLISSVALLFKAFRKMRFWDKWYLDHHDEDEDVEEATVFLAWYGFIVYSGQAFVRFVAGRKLQRDVIWHAFAASCVSLVFLLVLAIAATEEREWSWKAEPIAAMTLSFVTLAEGVRIIYNHFDDVDNRLDNDPRA